MTTTRRTPTARAVVILAAMASLSLTPLLDPARADTKEEIEETRRQIDRIVARMEQQGAEVAALQREATELAGVINDVLGRIAENEQRARDLQAEIDRAERLLLSLQAQLDARAREIYETGGGSSLELLLGATSFEDFTARLEFVNQAAQNDRDLIDGVENQQRERRQKQRELARVQSSLRARQAELELQQQALTAKLTAAQEGLSLLQADRAAADRLLSRLEDQRAREIEAARIAAAERAAEEEQARQEQEAPGGGGDSEGDGSSEGDGGSDDGGSDGGGGDGGGGGGGPFHACPVDPPRAYTNDFGAPRPGGRSHQGNDIFAPHGTPIRAPFPGRAVDASNALGGISVKVHGSQGFVYNAHLASIATLGSVETGTVIGYVGTTGNAQGTSPHNHFEWHPGNGGAVNPYPYLNEVC